jgi:ATP-dependent DNA helicase DinG
VLDRNTQQTIQTAYSRFLEQKRLNPRQGQKLMIAVVARTLGNILTDEDGARLGEEHVCVVEAGTGTGKTVAYALAAIPTAQAQDKKLVISTATVALQEQIMLKDLPDLRQHSGLVFNAVLAKGRGRYACLYKLDYLLAHGSTPGTQALYPDERDALLPDQTLRVFQTMLEALSESTWDGDRDNWSQAVDDEAWQRLTTDHSQCTGRRCAYVTQCPFFRARENLVDADVIVANHDLVLADLALGGGVILPAPEQAIFVFDEGHHLPDKALQHFAVNTRIQSSVRWLQSTTKTLSVLAKTLHGVHAVQSALNRWSDIEKKLLQAHQQVAPLLEQCLASRAEEREKNYLFPQGVVPQALREMASHLSEQWQKAGAVLQKVADTVEALLDSRSQDVVREVVEQSHAAVSGLPQRCPHAAALWYRYAHEDERGVSPTARWLTLHELQNGFDIEVCASPVLPTELLQKNLWERCFAAVITSATLTALGKFDRLRQRTGMPSGSVCTVVPSPFHYAQCAQLVVPVTAVESNLVEQHTQSVVDFMHNEVSLQEATLVLFASRRQMLEVYQTVSSDVRAAVLLQDDYSKQQLLQLHRMRIDQKQPSIIFGLASFAEGVDLPGDYLRHVVIAKIPFAPPDDPVGKTLSDWVDAQGGNAFMQIQVADASLRLVQASGRLLRTESDTGRISILDRRLLTKRYGKMLLDSLPPYQRVLN